MNNYAELRLFKRDMKIGTKIVLGIIVLACIIFVFKGELNFFGEEETNQPAVEGEPTSTKLNVEAIIAQSKPLDNNLNITGSLEANESVNLKSEVSGVVSAIYFKEGQTVKKGQLLLQLNDEELRAEMEKLQFSKKLNEDIEFRQKQLLKKEAISREEYEMALTTLNTSIADLRIKQVQLNKHKIRAPFDGVIGLREVSVGSYLNPSDAIANIYSINPIKVEFSIPGRYTSELNVGDKITFTVDAYEEEFKGSIYAIEPQIDPETRSIRIRAVCENREGKLLPGQFAKIILTISTFENTIMIPTESVIPELNAKKVYVYENGKAITKTIETGIRTSQTIQVVSGLNSGDTVITTGILQMQPNMELDVRIVNADAQ